MDSYLNNCINFRVSFRGDENQELVQRLLKEVQNLNPGFTAADIRSIYI